MMWPFRKRIQRAKDHFLFISYTRREQETREALPLIEYVTHAIRQAGYGLALDQPAWRDIDRLGHMSYDEDGPHAAFQPSHFAGGAAHRALDPASDERDCWGTSRR